MVRKFRYVTMVILCGLYTIVDAQIVINQLPPNPIRFTERDLFDVSIVNNDIAQGVYIKGVLIGDNGKRILECNSSVFVLKKGVVKINKNELGIVSLDFNTSNPTSAIVQQFKNLPYGNYSLCVYLYGSETNDLLVESCLDHEFQPVSPPILITPDYCQDVNTKYPLFTWLPPSPEIKGQAIYYDFKLAEVLGNQSYEDAIQRNPALISKQDLTTSSFLYPPSSYPLDTSKIYVWQVQAKIKKYNDYETPETSTSFHYIGVSETWCLNYKLPELPEIVTEKKSVTYALPKLKEDAEINVYDILFLAYTEDYVAGILNYWIIGDDGGKIDINIPLKVKKGENRYDINLKQTAKFQNKKTYKLVIQGSNNYTYYLKFRYFEQ